MNLLEAIDEPSVFGRFFQGDSWDAWRSFAAAVDGHGGSMTPEQAAIYRSCTGRTKLPTEPAPEVLACIGRRGGKSAFCSVLAAWTATSRDWAPTLRPGEWATIGVIATDREQAGIIHQMISGTMREIPRMRSMIREERDGLIELKNRCRIMVMTCSFKALRGFNFPLVIADEAAFFMNRDNSVNIDAEVFAAIRPGLASIANSRLIIVSSPHARVGEFFSIYENNYGKEEGECDVLVWQAATQVMNPRIDPKIIAKAYQRDPARASAEHGAVFRADLEAFIRREVLYSCVDVGTKQRPPVKGTRYFGFTDPSGGNSDSMTMAVAHAERDTVVLDLVLEQCVPFSPEDTVRWFSEVLKEYGIKTVIGDKYAAQFPVELFKKCGIVYEQSARPKSDIYLDVLAFINSGRIRLLDSATMLDQAQAMERRTSGGRDRVDHPRNGRDDSWNSACGALLCASGTQEDMIERYRVMAGLPAIIHQALNTGQSLHPWANRAVPGFTFYG